MTVATVGNIFIPYPETHDMHLWVKMGGGRLFLHRGEGSEWVSGSYTDPSGNIGYRVVQEGGTLWIMQDQNPLDFLGAFNGFPRFDLALGDRQPFTFALEAGGSDNHIDLGGVPLTEMVTKLAAGKLALVFSSPNPQPLGTLRLSCGAGQMTVSELANANFSELSVESGAGAVVLDFGGTLQRDGFARISGGLASIELRIPSTLAARIYTDSALVSTNIGDGFTRYDRAFVTPAAISGATPVLTIHTAIGVGSLTLRLT